MKTALIRLLTLATLATSMSTFASASESKRNDAANTSAATQQNGCTQGEGKKHKDTQKTQEESQQEQDFDRVLMGIYG